MLSYTRNLRSLSREYALFATLLLQVASISAVSQGTNQLSRFIRQAIGQSAGARKKLKMFTFCKIETSCQLNAHISFDWF